MDKKDDIDELLDSLIPPESEEKPADIVVPSTSLVEGAQEQSQYAADEQHVDATAMFNLVSSVLQNVVQRVDEDRLEISEVIDFFKDQVYDKLNNDERVPTSLVEALTKLLSTKSEQNTNLSRVMDSVAKIFSAGKGNDMFVTKIQGEESSDLTEILEQPLKFDEEHKKNG